jgi:hypothetical protein
MFDNLVKEIDSIQFRKKMRNGESIVHTGSDALYNFDESHWQNPNSVLNNLQSVLTSFEHLIFIANKIKYKYNKQKPIFLTRIYFLYYTDIIWPVNQILYTRQKDIIIQKGHPGAEQLFEKYENLTIQTYEYLLKGNLVGFPTSGHIRDLLIANGLKG